MRRSSKKLTRFLRFALPRSDDLSEDSLHDILAQDRHIKRSAKRLDFTLKNQQGGSNFEFWEAFDLDDAERVGSWIDHELFDGKDIAEVGIRSACEWMELTESKGPGQLVEGSKLTGALQNAIDSLIEPEEAIRPRSNFESVNEYSLVLEDSKPTIRNDRIPKRQGRRRRRGAIIGIGVVLAAIAIGVIAYALSDLRSGVEHKENDHFSSNQPELEESIEVQPWSTDEANNDSGDDSTFEPEQSPPSEWVIRPPRSDRHPPRPEWPEAIEAEEFYWTKANGVVAIRRPREPSWRLLSTDQSSQQDDPTTGFELRSLGNGWASGRTNNGVELIVCDQVHMHARLLPHDIWAVSLMVTQGRTSLQHLPSGAKVEFVYQGKTHTLLVHEDETVIAFDHSKEDSLFMLVSGSVEHETDVYTEPTEVRALQAGYASRRIVSNPPWLTEPTRLSAVEKRIAEKLVLESDEDLIEGIFANVAALSPEEVAVVSEWSISLDAERTIPLSLKARNIDQRRAAIAWLLDPATNREAMRPVLIDLQASLTGSRCVVARWIATARGEAPLSRRIIQNIQSGLAASEPLFVRELAIHLLRNLTGHAMSSYEPSRPTRQAVTEVSRIVQAWLSTRPEIN